MTTPRLPRPAQLFDRAPSSKEESEAKLMEMYGSTDYDTIMGVLEQRHRTTGEHHAFSGFDSGAAVEHTASHDSTEAPRAA